MPRPGDPDDLGVRALNDLVRGVAVVQSRLETRRAESLEFDVVRPRAGTTAGPAACLGLRRFDKWHAQLRKRASFLQLLAEGPVQVGPDVPISAQRA